MNETVSNPAGEGARLVLWGGTEGQHAKASLYALDANAYSEPLFTFALEPDQELPKIQPGDVVSVHGEMKKGARPIVDASGISITPASGLVPGAGQVGMRLFAERGGVLGHPAVIGWQPGWRYTRSTSLDPVPAWRRRLRSAIWGGRFSVVGLIVMLVLIVGAAARGGTVVPVYGGLMGIGSTIASYRLARRSRRALNGAENSLRRPSVRMLMKLTWTAGHGQGPMAVTTLFNVGDGVGEHPVAHISVINVPSGYAPEGLVPCDVIGDPTDAPVIRVPEGDLWPAEKAHLALGHQRLRFWRPGV